MHPLVSPKLYENNIQRLPTVQYRLYIVVLHSLTGLKHKEIAALLEMPLSTVLSKYNRAIKKLRKILKEEEINGR